MAYYQMKDGDTIELDKGGECIKFSCCDCGLTHKFTMKILDNGNIGVMIIKDNRATGQLRRYNKFLLEQKNDTKTK